MTEMYNKEENGYIGVLCDLTVSVGINVSNITLGLTVRLSFTYFVIDTCFFVYVEFFQGV